MKLIYENMKDFFFLIIKETPSYTVVLSSLKFDKNMKTNIKLNVNTEEQER